MEDKGVSTLEGCEVKTKKHIVYEGCEYNIGRKIMIKIQAYDYINQIFCVSSARESLNSNI